MINLDEIGAYWDVMFNPDYLNFTTGDTIGFAWENDYLEFAKIYDDQYYIDNPEVFDVRDSSLANSFTYTIKKNDKKADKVLEWYTALNS